VGVLLTAEENGRRAASLANMSANAGRIRGLLLIGAARRLPNGRAVGVDAWRNRDQGANSRAATLANARAAGLADRVEVLDGDARDLPLTDASFDAVVSSLVIHNIAGREGRDQAIGEAARVLRGGGRLALLDLRGTRDYVNTLRALGFTDVRRSRPRLSMYPPTRLVTARKPTDHPPARAPKG
jgi:arsenite methyltransferase